MTSNYCDEFICDAAQQIACAAMRFGRWLSGASVREWQCPWLKHVHRRPALTLRADFQDPGRPSDQTCGHRRSDRIQTPLWELCEQACRGCDHNLEPAVRGWCSRQGSGNPRKCSKTARWYANLTAYLRTTTSRHPLNSKSGSTNRRGRPQGTRGTQHLPRTCLG